MVKMKVLCVLFGLVAAAIGASLPERIVGGTSVDISTYPNIVQIEFLGVSWLQACGGAILTSRWILSAAHCFEDTEFTASNRRVRAGTSIRNYGGVSIVIESRINHPLYDNTMDNDIALARLASALYYSTVIQPVSIPKSNYAVPDNASVVLAGWGSLWNVGPAADVLHHVTIHTINRDICAERYAQRNDDVTNEFTASNRRVRAGTSIRNYGGVSIVIESRINHPLYDNTMDNDIALARLASALYYSTVIQPVSIPKSNYAVPDNASVVLAGWGSLWNVGPAADVLHHVTIHTINRDICAERYAQRNDDVTKNMICAGILDIGGKDACQGDSGGPMYYNNVLVGVVSWRSDCADPFYPGISTAVSQYTKWIIANAV